MNEIITCDNFYDNPLELRTKALSLFYTPKKAEDNHPGKDSIVGMVSEEFSNKVRKLLQTDGLVFPLNIASGHFRLTNIGDLGIQNIHYDSQSEEISQSIFEYSCIIYLSENEHIPENSGTSFWKHKATGLTQYPSINEMEKLNLHSDNEVREYFLINSTNNINENWHCYKKVDMAFNRLVIFKSNLFHAAEPFNGFGNSVANGRLIQNFFFSTNEFYKSHGQKKSTNR